MVSFFTHLINGLSLRSIYTIIAIGYTMVYGIAKMLNFAHGDVIMIGAFMAYTIISTMGLPTPLGIIGAIVICTCLGIVIEKIAYKPLRKAASPLAVLITAIGVSYFLQNSALLIFGSDPKMFTSVVPFQSVTIGSFSIPGTTIVSITVSIILVAALQTFINKTKPGQAMLACSQDRRHGSDRGCASVLRISDVEPDDRRYARYQGFRCSCFRRNRINTGCYDRRSCARRDRNPESRLHFITALGCDCIFRTYHSSSCKTYRTLRQGHSGKGLRRCPV